MFIPPFFVIKDFIKKINPKILLAALLITVFVAQHLTIIYWHQKYKNTCESLTPKNSAQVHMKLSCPQRINELLKSENQLLEMNLKAKESEKILDQLKDDLQSERLKEKEITYRTKERIINVPGKPTKTCISEPNMRVVIDSVRNEGKN